jgi:hypothetical protein
MATMALEESQDFNSVASGWDLMSFPVCFLCSFKAATKFVSKFVEEVEVDGTWDMMVLVEGLGSDAQAQAQRIISIRGTGAPAHVVASCLASSIGALKYRQLSSEQDPDLIQFFRLFSSLPITNFYLAVSCYDPYAENGIIYLLFWVYCVSLAAQFELHVCFRGTASHGSDSIHFKAAPNPTLTKLYSPYPCQPSPSTVHPILRIRFGPIYYSYHQYPK